MITGNEDTQRIVWPWLLADGQDILLSLLDTGDSKITPTVMILTHNATNKNRVNSELLSSSQTGTSLVRHFLKLADLHVDDEHSPAFDLAYLIIGNLLDLNLASNPLLSFVPAVPGVAHEEYSFLKLLDGRLDSSPPPSDPALLAALAALFVRTYDLATDVMFGFRDRISELPEGIPAEMALPSGQHDTESLILLLRLIGKMSQRLPAKVKEKWSEDSELLGKLLALLKDLEAAQPRRKPDPRRGPPVPGQSQNPFFLLKSDVVNAIGNLAFRTRKIQDEVRERGGLPMILEQCNLDDENPCGLLTLGG